RRHTRFSRDWSSDVCSSDLVGEPRRVSLAGAALVIAVLVSVAVASQAIYVETDLDATEYKVADLWQLFEGLMFIVVVMLLPHGRSEERRVGKECSCGCAAGQ